MKRKGFGFFTELYLNSFLIPNKKERAPLWVVCHESKVPLRAPAVKGSFCLDTPAECGSLFS